MTKHSWRRGVVALAVSAALSMTASVSQADNVSGSIYGQAKAGEKVTIVNTETGLKRDVIVEDGRFNFSQLPTGKYKVSNGQETYEVLVTIGTGTPVLFGRAGADVITVTASRISPIDTSSAESTTVFTQEQIQSLPVERDITNVALLAPGTVKGDTGFGNLAAIGGSSVAENGYYINGFDVTNIRTFLSYASLPFDAIAQQQVKTGGYGAEYGRSLGGVINLATKRGTNEWQFGGAMYWEPESLQEPGKDVDNRIPNVSADQRYYVYRSDNTSDSLVYNINAGGPLIQDKLFVFAMFEGRDNTADSYGRITSLRSSNNSPKALLKLDWNITDDHLLEFTGIRNKQEVDYVSYDNPLSDPNDPDSDPLAYTGEHGIVNSRYTIRNGGDVLIGKYTGQLTDDFTVSALWGNLTNDSDYQTPESLPGGECPRVYDSRANSSIVVYRGCWNPSQVVIRDPNFGPDTDERTALRLDAEWVLGDHTLRFGYDDETFESGHAGQVYTGGIYWRYFTAGSNPVNGVVLTPGTEYVRSWNFVSESASYEVNNSAVYVEDSWQVTDSLMVYAGVRNETFENKNGDGIAFVEADDLIAPRFGFSWDIDGNAEKKVFGTLGRYYIPVASNTNIRASGVEYMEIEYWQFSAIDPVTWAPTLTTQIGPTAINGSTEAPDPATVAATNLDPMHQDELILGYQQLLSENWTVGVRYINREVKDGMDDYCSHQAFVDWAADNGYSNFDPDSMATCIIINPGQDLRLNVDVNNDGNLVPVTIDASYLGLPKYKREYNALELFWEKSRGADDWWLQGSYTYAKSKGNVEGYVNSTLEQDDAGLTQDFDHALFEDGAYGYLPNDRRHTLKLFGAMAITEEWTLSASLLAQSGRPVSCNGYIPLDNVGIDASSLNAYAASSFYCVNEDGQTELTQRGDYGRTPWIYNVDMGVAYNPSWAEGLTLRADVFNVFNFDEVTEYSETGDINRASPERNPNFLNDVNYQSPRSVRLTARYSF
ncbi:MAG: TonB-dependent receptor domain-containing protein [Permianibacter sp.]